MFGKGKVGLFIELTRRPVSLYLLFISVSHSPNRHPTLLVSELLQKGFFRHSPPSQNASSHKSIHCTLNPSNLGYYPHDYTNHVTRSRSEQR